MPNDTITLRPASGALGAIVDGFDLRRVLHPDDVHEVHQLLMDHLVLFFRGQDLDDDDHLREHRCAAFSRTLESLQHHCSGAVS